MKLQAYVVEDVDGGGSDDERCRLVLRGLHTAVLYRQLGRLGREILTWVF